MDLRQGRELLSSEKGRKILIAVGVAVMLLLLLSTLDFGREKAADPREETPVQTEQRLEKRLEQLLSGISGVGEVHVMITLDTTAEQIYAEDTKTDSDRSDSAMSQSSSKETEVVLAGSSKEPLCKSVIQPKVRGAAVVCSGAADPAVKERVANAVAGVLNISLARVYVTC